MSLAGAGGIRMARATSQNSRAVGVGHTLIRALITWLDLLAVYGSSCVQEMRRCQAQERELLTGDVRSRNVCTDVMTLAE